MALPKWACQQTGFGQSLSPLHSHLVILFPHRHTYNSPSMTTSIILLTFLYLLFVSTVLPSSAASSVSFPSHTATEKNYQDKRQKTRGTPVCRCLCVIMSHLFSSFQERLPWRLGSLLWRAGLGHLGLAQIPSSWGGLLLALVVQNILTQTKSINHSDLRS